MADLSKMNDTQLLSGTYDEKQDRILLFLRSFGQRMEAVERKVEAVENKVDDFVTTTTNKVMDQNSRIDKLTEENKSIRKELKDIKNQHENESVIAEYHSKKYNLVCYNLKQEKDWETNVESHDIAIDFFANTLKVPYANGISIQNAHRMGNRKTVDIVNVVNEGTDDENTVVTKWHTRPLIVRFNNILDLESVQDHLSELKQHNANLPVARRIYVKQHLPKRMDKQRTALVPHFREARKRGQKTKWRIEGNGDYCLYINGVKFEK